MTTRPRRRQNLPSFGPRIADLDNEEPDIIKLAHEQGVPLRADFDKLLGDFWPEDEDPDEFVVTLRRWRQEGG